jgi:hypothetical protein
MLCPREDREDTVPFAALENNRAIVSFDFVRDIERALSTLNHQPSTALPDPLPTPVSILPYR